MLISAFVVQSSELHSGKNYSRCILAEMKWEWFRMHGQHFWLLKATLRSRKNDQVMAIESSLPPPTGQHWRSDYAKRRVGRGGKGGGDTCHELTTSPILLRAYSMRMPPRSEEKSRVPCIVRRASAAQWTSWCAQIQKTQHVVPCLWWCRNTQLSFYPIQSAPTRNLCIHSIATLIENPL